MPAKKAASKKSSVLRVTAPLVAVQTENGTVVHLFAGDVVPEGTSQDSIDHLIELEYLSDEDAPATAPEGDESDN